MPALPDPSRRCRSRAGDGPHRAAGAGTLPGDQDVFNGSPDSLQDLADNR